MTLTKRILIYLLMVIGMFVLAAPFVKAADTPTPQPKLSEVEELRLSNAQMKLKLAFATMQQQQAQFQELLNGFNGECEKVVKEHKLPEGTRCNPDNLSFVFPQKEEKKPEVKEGKK